MAGCGALMKVTGWKFLNDYALPISMVGGMLLAIPYTAWLG
jgi:Na+/glutamate symporter